MVIKEHILRLMLDPRHFQIVTLSVLVSLQMFWADFGPSVAVVVLTISSVLLVQAAFVKIFNLSFDFKSPLITGLSLSILLKAGAIWVYPLAALVAIGSKFLIRMNDQHIFNPANIGIIAALLLFPDYSWVSPGQWGAEIWLAVLLACLAFLVLYRIPRRDMVLIFLAIWSIMIFGRALWLGDPLSIPLHQLQSGALLIFAFFMISDPKTIPNARIGRIVFAFAVAVIAYILQFEFQLREALFYALGLVCLACPLIDRLWRADIFEWNTIQGEKL